MGAELLYALWEDMQTHSVPPACDFPEELVWLCVRRQKKCCELSYLYFKFKKNKFCVFVKNYCFFISMLFSVRLKPLSESCTHCVTVKYCLTLL